MTRIMTLAAILASSMLLASACGKNNHQERQSESGTVFQAIVSEAEVKTEIGEKVDDKYVVLWSEGDRIAVNGAVSTPLSSDDAGSDCASFVFNEKLSSPYLAVSPYSALVDEASVKIPSVQAPVSNGFDPLAAIMAASSDATELQFRQICAYLRIRVAYPDDCKRVATRAVFRGNDAEIISGRFALGIDDGDCFLGEVSSNAGKEISIVSGSTDGILKNFCISMPPQVLSKGFSIEFSDADGIFLKAETTARVNLKRGVILNAPELKFTLADGTAPGLVEIDGVHPDISWGKPVLVSGWCSTYGRVHRLNDGRLMMCYSNTWTAKARFSSDDGATWGSEKAVVKTYKSDELTYKMDNPEFAQLSADNPHHPGRIIYAVNERVRDADGNMAHPFHISVCTSDDNGATWSPSPVKIYSSNNVSGCYEPFVLELPDGTVQIYFADETPYAYKEISYQNISVIESTDGGDTWGSKRIVCYTYAQRDGMPTATVYDGNIYVAIEACGNNVRFYPQIVYNPISESWGKMVRENSPYRFDPFETSMRSSEIYSGAPYLIQTDNYFVMSYQTTKGATQATYEERYKHTAMEVQLCPKSEIVNGKFSTMRGATRPVALDQTSACAKWNSLCHLGGDEILAVYSSGGEGHEGDTGFLYVVKGRVTTTSLDLK